MLNVFWTRYTVVKREAEEHLVQEKRITSQELKW